jgi:ABC-type siderophore export system fused ATPase/permease subunit
MKLITHGCSIFQGHVTICIYHLLHTIFVCFRKKYNFYLQSATRKSWNFKVFVYNLYKQLQVESVKRAYLYKHIYFTNAKNINHPKIIIICFFLHKHKNCLHLIYILLAFGIWLFKNNIFLRNAKQ